MRVRDYVGVVWFAGCLVAPWAAAHDTGSEHPHEGTSSVMPEIDPAVMEKMIAAMMPGKPHEGLKYYVGNWKNTTKMWMSPDGEPMVSEGTCTTSWLMDGRYLHTSYSSTMMGQPFQGYSIDGFDNQSGKHWNLWLDSMGTGYFLSEGMPAADGKSVTLTGSHMDPMTGPSTHTLVVKERDANSYEMTMFSGPKGGEEVKVLEVVYTRS